MTQPIKSLNKIYSGKVRDLYEIDEKIMLMVATDRLSTFDIILNQPIQDKGKYLTKISLFWFNYFKNLVPSHLVDYDLSKILTNSELEYVKCRSSVVKRLKQIPIEVIVRGYLAGSGYKDYIKNGEISGVKLPHGLKNAQRLPEPIFTPSTKAACGDHDENITVTECENLIGKELTLKISDLAIKLYQTASKYAETKNIIIADTKFEFGLDENGTLTLMDEVLTPDSSRFWDKDTYIIGSNPPSFDKQFVRDYLELEIKWNKQPPIPDLPNEIIAKTQAKYIEITNRLI
ncbi:MAG: phosphoribosylaminoimidazolesuccinocarboxamide synthase [Neisseriaceae bacterium]